MKNFGNIEPMPNPKPPTVVRVRIAEEDPNGGAVLGATTGYLRIPVNGQLRDPKIVRGPGWN